MENISNSLQFSLHLPLSSTRFLALVLAVTMTRLMSHSACFMCLDLWFTSAVKPISHSHSLSLPPTLLLSLSLSAVFSLQLLFDSQLSSHQLYLNPFEIQLAAIEQHITLYLSRSLSASLPLSHAHTHCFTANTYKKSYITLKCNFAQVVSLLLGCCNSGDK